MRVSHSWTPKLNILEILKHFWPASEPCMQATIKDMDFIFPVPALRSVIYPPCKYESMGMHRWSTVICRNWGQFRWNLVIYWSKCPIMKGSIKRPNLQTADRYRAESFRVDSNMFGWSTCAVTRSDIFRVSHSWKPKLNIPEILKHFWPASEPCLQATIKDMDFIFPVPALRSVIYPPCKYESMDMHSWSTVVCQTWGHFRWNLVIYGSKCRFLKMGHQTGRSTNGLNIQGWIIQGRFQYDWAIYLCSYKVWPYAGQSQLDAKIEYS